MLTECTDVINYGPLDYADRYQEVIYRGLGQWRFWSGPFQLNLWTTYRAKNGCIDVLDPPHDSSSTSDWKAEDVA